MSEMHLGVLGWPIAHTLSPALHQAAFQAASLDQAHYGAYGVPPERLAEAVRGLKALGFLGCNVTRPHKHTVIEHLDGCQAEAVAVGAVNTIYRDQDRLLGANTDVDGFLACLRPWPLVGLKTLVLGSGGAARAVAYGLQREGAEVFVRCRRSGALAGWSQPPTGRFLWDEPLPADRFHLLVNATPIGQQPDEESVPVDSFGALRSDAIVADLVYRPHETRLLQTATAQGLRTVHGIDMLVHQAALAWRYWFGQEASREAMYEAAERELGLSLPRHGLTG